MRLGVFGGTFDPLHIGHLIVADDAAAALDLDRVLFVPAGTHPFKKAQVHAPSEIRLEMVRRATAESDLFVPDDRELRRSGPSYTVDTLTELREEHPNAELFLLVGADILDEIDKWHESERLSDLARVIVLSRPEFNDRPAGPARVETERVAVTLVDVSSTEIRRRIRSGAPYRYLVPDPVRRIIEDNSLYKNAV